MAAGAPTAVVYRPVKQQITLITEIGRGHLSLVQGPRTWRPGIPDRHQWGAARARPEDGPFCEVLMVRPGDPSQSHGAGSCPQLRFLVINTCDENQGELRALPCKRHGFDSPRLHETERNRQPSCSGSYKDRGQVLTPVLRKPAASGRPSRRLPLPRVQLSGARRSHACRASASASRRSDLREGTTTGGR